MGKTSQFNSLRQQALGSGDIETNALELSFPDVKNLRKVWPSPFANGALLFVGALFL